jgi:hypothetical protein
MKHLLAVWKQTKVKPQELEELGEPPQELVYLWQWLNEHAPPLLYAELSHWQMLTGRKLKPWEVETMMRLDRIRN